MQTLRLYILIFLHQTATWKWFFCIWFCCISLYSYIKPQHDLDVVFVLFSCISLYSYIKPQLQDRGAYSINVVYPYIPTSNRNTWWGVLTVRPVVYPYIPTSNRNTLRKVGRYPPVVYPYIPTSNRNSYNLLPSFPALYILIFLHQTATLWWLLPALMCCISLYSYIKPQLNGSEENRSMRCISLYSYIKPQPARYCPRWQPVVYPYIPTSNRNLFKNCPYWPALYILIFLHQTATVFLVPLYVIGCISLYSYIKPQLEPPARHFASVVYPYIPTSNRNGPRWLPSPFQLYILIFLHQTATPPTPSIYDQMLYILIFLHQTATTLRHSKINLELYILIFLHQTATHRCCTYYSSTLYILIFLHQTATMPTLTIEIKSCISLYSYIKPQLMVDVLFFWHVVYPYIPTSNRNKVDKSTWLSKVVYPYIPTSNRNYLSMYSKEVRVVYPYIPTSNRNLTDWPMQYSRVVYPYIPTSNRNFRCWSCCRADVVYPYIPTSNRNYPHITCNAARLYILIFLHQTATYETKVISLHRLYILIFLHQTATRASKISDSFCCISLYSYIKPQL